VKQIDGVPAGMQHASTHVVTRAVRVGGKNKEKLLAELERAGIQLNEAARTLLSSKQFTTSMPSRQLITVELTVRQLGFTQGATLCALHDQATALGLFPPPLDLGPHLRLQYLDQAEGFWGHPVTEHQAPPGSITIASAPLSEEDEFPKGFYLRRIKGALWLRGYRCGMEHLWNSGDRLVFCQL
jgi:hypothetical protein